MILKHTKYTSVLSADGFLMFFELSADDNTDNWIFKIEVKTKKENYIRHKIFFTQNEYALFLINMYKLSDSEDYNKKINEFING